MKYKLPDPEDVAEAAFQGCYERLEFQYGRERAQAIMDGKDAATEADKKSWRALGRPK